MTSDGGGNEAAKEVMDGNDVMNDSQLLIADPVVASMFRKASNFIRVDQNQTE